MDADRDRLRALVVSHAAVIPVNQEPFAAMADAGVDVTLVVPRALHTDIRGPVRFRELQGFPGTILPVPVRFGLPGSFLRGQRGVHLIAYARLAQILAEVEPDVLFLEEEPFSVAAAQLARLHDRTGVRFVVHENQNIERRLPPPFASIQRRVLTAAAAMTVRNEVAGEIARAKGFFGPLHLFPHAVDPARYSVAGTRVNLPPPVVGFVGRLVPEKGIVELVEAMALVRDRTGAGSLVVVGDGPARAIAQARASALHVPASFLGAVAHEEVPRYYAGMDLVAVPSKTTATWKEQFGRIVIEANAAGVPVVVSDSGELPATVRATGGGVVAREGDVAALAEAIAGLLEDEQHRRALGGAGRAAVERTYSVGAIGRALGAFLREVAVR